MITTLDEAIKHCKEKVKEIRQANEEMPIDCKLSKELCECANDHEQLAEWLTELKERREKDRWRKATAEPPKEHDYYLVTLDFEEVAQATDIALFYPDRGARGEWSLDCVTYWKPLPEPYKESEVKNGD